MDWLNLFGYATSYLIGSYNGKNELRKEIADQKREDYIKHLEKELYRVRIMETYESKED